jgi:hypothetical protein
MPRGGARLNSGPAPDPNALRRDRKDDRDGWVTLPAEGYQGDIPDWPLAGGVVGVKGGAAVAMQVAMQEAEIWRRVWRTPQAVWWAQNGLAYEVAVYCRLSALAETGHGIAASEARQWSDRLGLNPAAMLRNRWRVAPTAEQEQQEPAEATGRSSRSRLRVVADGEAG